MAIRMNINTSTAIIHLYGSNVDWIICSCWIAASEALICVSCSRVASVSLNITKLPT